MTETSQGGSGYIHELVRYGDTRELVSAAAPLLRDALAAGQGVALVCSEDVNQALHAALDGDDRVSALPRNEVYQKAVSAIGYFRDFVEERLADGVTSISIIGEVDFGTDRWWVDEGRRYEALLNHAMSSYPVLSLCAYDTRWVPGQVLAGAELTHPHLRQGPERVPNPRYADPAELLREVDAAVDLAPDGEALLTIPHAHDLTQLHGELMAALVSHSMPRERAQDMVAAVHEVVTNGLRHGAPPVSVQVWVTPDRVTCEITDRGRGFADPFTGYIRGGGRALEEGQYGLWLARQLCDELTITGTTNGFTARLATTNG